jgi:integrase
LDDTSTADRQKTIRPLTLQHVEALLDAVRTREHEWTLFLVLADAGLRPQEAAALQWEDFNGRAQTLHVERAVTLAAGSRGLRTGTARDVELTPGLTDALVRSRARCQREAETAGRELGPWTFPGPNGTPLTVQAISKRFRRVLRRRRSLTGTACMT